MRYLLTLLFSLSIAFSCFAQHNTRMMKSYQRANQSRAELVNRQDELLELLLQIPFEQRQYIFPMLSAEETVPKKIRTHPEIAIWKGKLPTRIAERFQNDPEFVQYLPEQFYSYLAPEMWISSQSEEAERNPNQILKNMINTRDNEGTKSAAMPDELVVLYNGLNILQKEKSNNFSKYIQEDIKNISSDTLKELEEKTGLSSDTFAQKVDNVAKCYRLYQKQKTPPKSSEQELVLNYWSLIPFIFQKTGFSEMLNPNAYTD